MSSVPSSCLSKAGHFAVHVDIESREVFGTIEGRKVVVSGVPPEIAYLGEIDSWREVLASCTLHEVRGEVWVNGWLKKIKKQGVKQPVEKEVPSVPAVAVAPLDLHGEQLNLAKQFEQRGTESLEKGDLEQANQLLRRALIIKRKNCSGLSRLDLTTLLQKLAELAVQRKKYRVALVYYDEERSIFRECCESNDIRVGISEKNLALTHMLLKEYKIAESFLYVAVSIFDEHKDVSADYFSALQNLAECNFQLGEYNDMLTCCERALKLLESAEINDSSAVISQIHMLKRLALFGLNQLQEGQNSIASLNEDESNPLAAGLAMRLGEMCFKKNEIKDAIACYEKAYKLYLEENKTDRGECLERIGRCYRLQKQLPLARKYYHQAIELFKEDAGSMEHMLICYFCLADVCNGIKEFDQALHYYKKTLHFLEKLSDLPEDIVKTCRCRIKVLMNMFHQTSVTSTVKTVKEALKLEKQAEKAQKEGQFRQAAQLFEEALEIRKVIQGEHLDVSALHYKLANLYFGQLCDPSEAEPHYMSHLQFVMRFGGGAIIDLVRALVPLAECLYHVRELSDVIHDAKEALNLLTFIPPSPEVTLMTSKCYQLLIRAFKKTDINQSIEYLNKALSFYEAKGDTAEIANTLLQLTDFYKSQEKDELAIESCKKAIVHLKKPPISADKIKVAEDLLAELVSDSRLLELIESSIRNTNDYAASCDYTREAEGRKKTLTLLLKFYESERHPRMAVVHFELASCYLKQNLLLEALTHAGTALKINLELYNANHPKVASCHDMLGEIHSKQEKKPEASGV